MTKEYKIGGITVHFPYKAYGPQLAYMGKVVATLEQSRLRKEGRCNALLESPTGSGKSLALLCATLAWQQHYLAVLSSNPTSRPEAGSAMDSSDVLVAGGGFVVEESSTGLEPGNMNSSPSFQQMPHMSTCQTEIAPKSPRIFYATRTHAQITQVIREFRKTKYRVPMAILASKKHYCTNKSVQKKKNVDEDWNAGKVKEHPSLQQGACNDIHDIEDLVKIGHSVRGCAYFAARAMATDADIVFCPYSYIVDPIIREAVEADIRGSIIIFDEAHNIEDVAREAGSTDLETSVLVDMQSELQMLRVHEPTAQYCEPLLEMVQELLGWTEYHAKHLTKLEFEHHSSCWTGNKAIQELSAAGIPLERFEVLLSFSRKAIAAASDEKVAHLSARLVNSLERLFRVLQFMLCNNARRSADYQLVVQKFVRRDTALFRPAWVVSVSLWCLNPAVVFEEISATSRSIIVTSGTLAPVESFASELGVMFDIRIEAPHVVDMDTQVWAAALSVGPRAVVLNASYKNAENFVFQDAVGAALLEIFKVTPDGVLVFLPSYKLLTKLCDRWQSTGHWLLLASLKQLFIEPRVNDVNFESVLHGYYGAIKGDLPDNKQTSKKSTKNLKAQVQAPAGKTLANGAAFLAVCRGKVSEGIDFSDKNARVVVVVGIPFPNVKDIQVTLKKQYNSTHKETKNLLSGDQWYCQQAFRALNQAVGRCIRHRYDYGGIILLDERFKIAKNLEFMSKWLRKSIRQSDNFEASMGCLQNFFSRLKELDLRASGGPTETNVVETIPELPIPGHNRASSPITPVPIRGQNKELLSVSLGARRQSDSICNLESSGLKTMLCRVDECGAQDSATPGSPPEKRCHCFSNATDLKCFESAGRHEAACTVTHSGKGGSETSPHLPSMYCQRCGLNFGTISSSEIRTLQKSHFTSLLNSNRPESQRLCSPTPVYFTDISLIGSGLTKEREPGVQAGNCKRRQSGVWVEEDGCVFKPLVCFSCNSYIGVHIIAADNYNLALIGKVAIFAQSIKQDLERKSSEGCCEESLFQHPESLRPICFPSKRVIEPRAKGKLKLRRQEK